MTEINWVTPLITSGFITAYIGMSIRHHGLRQQQMKTQHTLSTQITEMTHRFGLACHEIRAPLTAILATLDCINQKEVISSSEKQLIHHSQALGQATLNLLNQLVENPDQSSDQITCRYEPYDLKQLVHSCVDPFISQATHKQVSISVDLCKDLSDSLFTDALRLRQIFNNLINNALKHTSKGRIEISATVIANDYFAQLVEFRISDTGSGFSSAEPLTSFGQTSSQLGLLLSRQLIELMHGQLTIHSSSGMGSTLSFHLPLKRSTLNPINHKDVPASPTLKMILIEDHLATGYLLTKQFRRMGCDARLCHSKEEAKILIDEKTFDAAIIDFQIGGQSGIDIANMLKATCPQLKLYGYTGNPHILKNMGIHENLFHHILIKPTDEMTWKQILFLSDTYQKNVYRLAKNDAHIAHILYEEILKQQIETFNALSKPNLRSEYLHKLIHKTMGGASITADSQIHKLCRDILKKKATTSTHYDHLRLALKHSNQVLKDLIANTMIE